MPRKPRSKMTHEELAKARAYDAQYKRKQRASPDHVEKRSKDYRKGSRHKGGQAAYMRNYRKQKKESIKNEMD